MSSPLKLTAHWSRNFFTARRNLSLQAIIRSSSASPASSSLSVFSEELLFSSLPIIEETIIPAFERGINQQKMLSAINLCGIDAARVSKLSSRQNHLEMEILYLGGSFIKSSLGARLNEEFERMLEEYLLEEGMDKNFHGEEQFIPFFLQLRSHFQKIDDKQQLVFQVLLDSSPALHLCGIETLRQLFDLHPEVSAFRLGYQLFRSHFFGSLLGLAPLLDAQHALRATAEELSIFFSQEFPRKPAPPKLDEIAFLQVIAYCLEKAGYCSSFLEKSKEVLASEC